MSRESHIGRILHDFQIFVCLWVCFFSAHFVLTTTTRDDNGNNNFNMPDDGNDYDDIGTQHFNIGDNLRHKAFYEESIDELQTALKLLETKHGANSPVVANVHHSIGCAYRATKDYSQAMRHLKTASDIFESQDDYKTKFNAEIKNCKLNIARTHHSRGVAYQRGGEYDASVLEHRKAIGIRESILGRSHLETARSHYVMGCALRFVWFCL